MKKASSRQLLDQVLLVSLLAAGLAAPVLSPARAERGIAPPDLAAVPGGSATGLETTAAWTADPDSASIFGYSVATAGM